MGSEEWAQHDAASLLSRHKSAFQRKRCVESGHAATKCRLRQLRTRNLRRPVDPCKRGRGSAYRKRPRALPDQAGEEDSPEWLGKDGVHRHHLPWLIELWRAGVAEKSADATASELVVWRGAKETVNWHPSTDKLSTNPRLRYALCREDRLHGSSISACTVTILQYRSAILTRCRSGSGDISLRTKAGDFGKRRAGLPGLWESLGRSLQTAR